MCVSTTITTPSVDARSCSFASSPSRKFCMEDSTREEERVKRQRGNGTDPSGTEVNCIELTPSKAVIFAPCHLMNRSSSALNPIFHRIHTYVLICFCLRKPSTTRTSVRLHICPTPRSGVPRNFDSIRLCPRLVSRALVCFLTVQLLKGHLICFFLSIVNGC